MKRANALGATIERETLQCNTREDAGDDLDIIIDLREESRTSGPADITSPSKRYLLIQRSIDLALALPALILLSPVLALIAVAVRSSSTGSATFAHPRVGRGRRDIAVLKFRTMYIDAEERLNPLLESDPALAEEWKQYHKLALDPRVTPVGRWLRRTSLDELPQLVNVVRGEMTLVGPRPVTAPESERYGDHFDTVVGVRPGITGAWQAGGRNGCTFEERVQLDVEFAKEHSVRRNLRILGRTFRVVATGDGAT